MYLKTCEYCEEEFYTARKDGCYCSSSCRQSAYRKRKEDESKTAPDYYPQVVTPLSDDPEEVEYVEAEEVDQNTEITFPTEKKEAPSGDNVAKTRQMQVTNYFIGFLVHLRNIYGENVKREVFEEVLSSLEDLKNKYMSRSVQEYTLYPFADDLEKLIAELDSYLNRKVKHKAKQICFDLGEDYLLWLYDLETDLSNYNRSFRKPSD